jgi:hypothetical protein
MGQGLLVRSLSFAAACLSLAACQASASPIIVYVTPEPTPIIVYVTPGPTPIIVYVTPEPNATPEDTPTPEATAAPTPTPNTAAAFCSGSSSNQAFFLQAARGVKFTVYCATALPSGWAISSGAWQGSGGGYVDVVYKYKNTSQRFELKEGSFCTTSKIACWGGFTVSIGSGLTKFDGMEAEIGTLMSSNDIVVAVASGTTHAYILTGTNVPSATMIAIAANMKAVPKT